MSISRKEIDIFAKQHLYVEYSYIKMSSTINKQHESLLNNSLFF